MAVSFTTPKFSNGSVTLVTVTNYGSGYYATGGGGGGYSAPVQGSSKGQTDAFIQGIVKNIQSKNLGSQGGSAGGSVGASGTSTQGLIYVTPQAVTVPTQSKPKLCVFFRKSQSPTRVNKFITMHDYSQHIDDLIYQTYPVIKEEDIKLRLIYPFVDPVEFDAKMSYGWTVQDLVKAISKKYKDIYDAENAAKVSLPAQSTNTDIKQWLKSGLIPYGILDGIEFKELVLHMVYDKDKTGYYEVDVQA